MTTYTVTDTIRYTAHSTDDVAGFHQAVDRLYESEHGYVTKVRVIARQDGGGCLLAVTHVGQWTIDAPTQLAAEINADGECALVRQDQAMIRATYGRNQSVLVVDNPTDVR